MLQRAAAGISVDIFPVCVAGIPVRWQPCAPACGGAASAGVAAAAGAHAGGGRPQRATKLASLAPLQPRLVARHEQKLFGTSDSLDPWDCHGWVQEEDPQVEVLCELAAKLLQQQSVESEAPPLPTRWSRFAQWKIELQPKFSFRARVLYGEPCVAVMVAHLARAPPEFCVAKLCGSDADKAIGLEVCFLPDCRGAGKVVGFAGQLSELRQDLLAKCSRPETRQALIDGSDQESCWHVQFPSDKKVFKFLGSQLQPKLTMNNMEQLRRFSGSHAIMQIGRDSFLRPMERQRLVAAEVERLRSHPWGPVAKLFPSLPQRVDGRALRNDFMTFPVPQVSVGKGELVSATTGSEVWASMERHGLHRYHPLIGTRLSLHGCVLGRPVEAGALRDAEAFLQRIARMLCSLGLTVSVGPLSTASSAAAALDDAQEAGVQAVLLFATSSAEAWYDAAKCGSFKRPAPPGLQHVATQWVTKRTWASGESSDEAAEKNVALQICAKVGHTPYGLPGQAGTPDSVVCGVDACHLRDPATKRMTHVVGAVRLRWPQGELDSSWTACGRHLSESVPPAIWETVLSEDACSGRQVVIHRDGRFTTEERHFLERHARSIKVAGPVGLVEVVKHAGGTPRMYAGASNAAPGSFLRLSDSEGLLISGTFRGAGTRNPLHVRVAAGQGLAIEEVAKDIFWLSFLSYANLFSTPRLPVTTKTADLAAYASARHRTRRHDEKCNDPVIVCHGRQQYWL